MILAIVGAFSGTHLGGSLARAADRLGIETLLLNTAEASRGPRLLSALRWRFDDRKALWLERFSQSVAEACTLARPDMLLVTGPAPVTESALRTLGKIGVFRINFSSDDPWNRGMGSHWHRRALPLYDVVFTPRRANLEQLQGLGCRDVRYLPFGYDDALFAPPDDLKGIPSHEVLFVGGADRDRVEFFQAFLANKGPAVTLVGQYWNQTAALRPFSLGPREPEALRALTAAAKVNLCLVRRANRDGHVMRSFEIAAIGGCMLVEDTVEHRDIFGPDGESVVYFRDPAEAAAKSRALIADPGMRARLARNVRERIARDGNTYRDRLACMIAPSSGRPSQDTMVDLRGTAP